MATETYRDHEYIKWAFDGCNSMEDLITTAKAMAKVWKAMAKAGIKCTGVDQGYIMYETDSLKAANKYIPDHAAWGNEEDKE